MKTVVAALIEAEGKLLACQRRRDVAFGLMWEFPGGKTEGGETPEEALARELQEELGAAVRIGAEVYRTRHKYVEMPEAIELIFFACRVVRGEVKNLDFEKIAWCEPHDLRSMNFLAADRELIELLAEGSLRLAVDRSDQQG
jgi:8-oxo-dGTP diphosphatase